MTPCEKLVKRHLEMRAKRSDSQPPPVANQRPRIAGDDSKRVNFLSSLLIEPNADNTLPDICRFLANSGFLSRASSGRAGLRVLPRSRCTSWRLCSIRNTTQHPSLKWSLSTNTFLDTGLETIRISFSNRFHQRVLSFSRPNTVRANSAFLVPLDRPSAAGKRIRWWGKKNRRRNI